MTQAASELVTPDRVEVPPRLAPPGSTRPRPAVAEGRDGAAERVAALVDPGSLSLIGAGGGGGVASGRGRVGGLPVEVFATEPGRRGGALSFDDCARIGATIDRARLADVPVVGIWHSGGADLREGMAALDGVSRIFRASVAASGRVPQLSLVVGPAAGGAAYGPALTDLVVMTGEARVFVTGPEVVRRVTGEATTAEDLGGPRVHGRSSGVAHVIAEGRAAGVEATRRLVGLLGDPGRFHPAGARPTADAATADPGRLLPASPRRAYDVRPLVDAILDGPATALQGGWAANVHTALGRLAGRTIGVVANNPLRRGGCLDAAAGDKAARFVRMCDAFGIPLLVLVDVPGYLPGVAQERDGVVRRGAKLLHAFAGATVPRITIITRKAFGGAYVAMNSKGLGATAVYAWPTAEVGIMNPESAVDILHRRDLAAAAEADRPALRGQLAEGYAREATGVARAVDVGIVDAEIAPAETRAVLIAGFAGAGSARGSERNVPL
ncbi:acyl-CoA carboxylase subunit beta [Frankia sp. AgB32]|uniref:acyl-CoA carboxylase subunit beta n=1 Tax=Frankia sp. AgB32 TaxID=631119 RepID=UPI00200EC9C6|nr:carboxyl transferase domain-containing protein [Frankia sp. AgB32]MCK9897089.1 acyl-CoA carboxylase subunit beta [Frankia sp. AgB32]